MLDVLITHLNQSNQYTFEKIVKDLSDFITASHILKKEQFSLISITSQIAPSMHEHFYATLLSERANVNYFVFPNEGAEEWALETLNRVTKKYKNEEGIKLKA